MTRRRIFIPGMPLFWIPRFKIVEPKKPLMATTHLEGWWNLSIRRSDGRVRRDTGWFPNIITDVGLNQIGTLSTYLSICRVGTGSATPTALDTSLGSQIASTSSVQSSVAAAQGSPPYYGSFTRTWRFAAGVAAGNLTEIGVGFDASGAIFSRALILDGSGNPTTITVLPDEFLDATYQIRLKPPLVDVNSTINISGIDYDTITRAGRVTNSTSWSTPSTGGGSNTFNYNTYTGNIAAITTLPSGSIFFSVAGSLAYGDGNLYRDFSDTMGLDESNNVAGIRTIGYQMGQGGAMGHMQTQFDPVIAKDNTKVLTVTFRHTWARGTP
jgi:hypothetical protein